MNPEFAGEAGVLHDDSVWRRRRRAAFILNPCAGAGRAVHEWQQLIGTVEELFGSTGYTVAVTSCQWDAVLLTMAAIGDGYTLVVSVGGDGTHNEVVNGYMRAGGYARGVEFATLSLGSGSDLDRTLYQGARMSHADKLALFASGPSLACDVGLLRCAAADYRGRSLPFDAWQCAAAPLPLDGFVRPAERLGHGPTMFADGVVERFFINIAGCGIGGAVCRAVNSSSKALGGFATFCYATVATSLTWVNPAVRWQTEPAQPWQEASIYMFLLGNGRHQGGGMKPVPHADIADGLLDLVVIRDFGPADVLKIPSIYSGTHFKHKPRVFGRRLTTVVIEPTSDLPVWIETDGETPGKLPAAFHLLPSAIRIVCPPPFIDQYSR